MVINVVGNLAYMCVKISPNTIVTPM